MIPMTLEIVCYECREPLAASIHPGEEYGYCDLRIDVEPCKACLQAAADKVREEGGAFGGIDN